jgi:cbb3-type cytochrome oxidase subunit 3
VEEDAMPVESLAVTVGVVAVFMLFSVVLAWAYRQTNGR